MSYLTVKDLSKSFGRIKALDQVSFACDKDEPIGIVGPSGSGKSVLIKLLAAIFPYESGSIEWEGESQPNTGFLFQEGALFDSMTVEENVMFPLVAQRSHRPGFNKGVSLEVPTLSKNEAREKAHEMLGFVGLHAAVKKLPSELSGGMRKRVGIARALVHSPQVLLLDDPTSGLDPITANTIMNLIERLVAERDCMLIMVSHDIRRLIPRVKRILMLEKGILIADCNTSDLKEEAPPKMIQFLKTRFDFANG